MRRGIGGGSAACLAILVSTLPGVAQTVPMPARFGAIAIDTSHLEEIGARRAATLLRQQLGAEVRQVFADRLAESDRRAPLLVVRIKSLSLASYVGRSAEGFPGFGNTDYLEGDGVVTAGGRVLSSTHVLSALDAGYSGAWTLPDIDERRVASISHHFAYWLRHEMGL